MSLGPLTFPNPGEPAFQELTPEEQLWVTQVLPWHDRSLMRAAPSMALQDPFIEQFRLFPELHVPKLLRFFHDSPLLMEIALMHALECRPPNLPQAERHAFWKDAAAKELARRKKAGKTQAAE